ncbi:hypothetical protein STEG23_016981 [Scotinomys teguina]
MYIRSEDQELEVLLSFEAFNSSTAKIHSDEHTEASSLKIQDQLRSWRGKFHDGPGSFFMWELHVLNKTLPLPTPTKTIAKIYILLLKFIFHTNHRFPIIPPVPTFGPTSPPLIFFSKKVYKELGLDFDEDYIESMHYFCEKNIELDDNFIGEGYKQLDELYRVRIPETLYPQLMQ